MNQIDKPEVVAVTRARRPLSNPSAQAKAMLAAAAEQGWLGAKDLQLGGRFSTALVEAAQLASGLTERTDLLTYALAKVAFEDNYGEKLLALKGTVPRGTFGD